MLTDGTNPRISFSQTALAPKSTPLDIDEALAIVDNLVLNKRRKVLSEAEILVIRGAWYNEEYKEMSQKSRYSCNYLQRRVAPVLWGLLSELIGDGEKVEKHTLRYFLERAAGKSSKQTHASVAKKTAQPLGSRFPEVSNFYGRSKELSLLREMIFKKRCVLLVGVAGVGKSLLAAKLITGLNTESSPNFDYIIWKSVAHAPLLPDLIAEIIELIQPEQRSSQVKYTQPMISMLIKQLQSHRCLIVLDEFEVLLQKNNFERRLDYKMFFRRLAEELEQSCVLLSSQIFPEEIESLMSAELPVDFLRLEGLEVDVALQLLRSKGLTDEKRCKELIQTYRGNPSELKAIVNRINHFFAGSTEKFFERPTTLVSDQFQEMLDSIFSQELLTAIQKEIMIYLTEELSLNSNGISFAKILFDMLQKHGNSISTLEIIKGLEGLEKNSLVESIKDPVTKEISFKVQPVTRKYIKIDPLGLVHSAIAS